MLILKITEYLLFVVLGLAVLYILVFSVAGLFYRDPKLKHREAVMKIAVLIPGYKEDEVIVETARQALGQNYPPEDFDVVVIADSFRAETLQSLGELDIITVKVSFEKSTKAKALNRAMEVLPGPYDIAVVLDADNLMEPDFLGKISRVFTDNISAVQGHRTAKNLNTGLAVLDAASEEINNHIFRKGHRVFNLSSALIGSGMAFRYEYFRTLMAEVTAVGGFDKEIELKMLRERRLIEYLDSALVYDEKVQKAEVFGNQRRRWLSAQFHYFSTDFLSALTDLLTKGNLDYFDKAFQFIQPPRILLLGAVIATGVFFISIDLFLKNDVIAAGAWTGLITACIASFLFSLPRSFYNMRTLRALADLPGGVILMLKSLLRIRGANKTFIHTSHSSVSLNKNK
jgi:cellulose synthase/poly-beta-1,6-N-acetylglucosamine synthase-like glycosyltransferase